MSDLLKKWAIRSFAHFWWETWALCSQLLIPTEQPERIVHRRSFDLSDSLTVLRRNGRILCLLKTSKKTVKNVPKYDFFEFFWANCSFIVSKKINERLLKKPSNSLICSFVLSNLSKSLTLAHMSWATWAIRSQSLICPDRPEWMPHLLICPERFERMSDEQMCEFQTLVFYTETSKISISGLATIFNIAKSTTWQNIRVS